MATIVENFFCGLEDAQRHALRQTDQNFSAMILLALAVTRALALVAGIE